jgi:tetraprenyl-beta-curcumene synthase
MGPPANGNIVVLFYANGLAPVLAQIVMQAELIAGSETMPGRLETQVPLIASVPAGPPVSILSVNATIGPAGLTYYETRHGRRVAFHPRGVSVPRHCPHGGFRFSARFTFADASTASATYSVPAGERIRASSDIQLGMLARMRERLALTAAFALLAARYWLTVYPGVIAHMRRSHARASTIADPALRALVLQSLAKRSNLEGAAAFAALAPRATRGSALRALLAFQSIYNYADVLGEQPTADSLAAVRYAHVPLAHALGLRAPTASLQLEGPWAGDNGYLDELLTRCQESIAALPSAAIIRESALARASDIAEFQAHSSPAAAPDELERWVSTLPPRAPQMSWSETAAACGSSLAVHALIAAASTPSLDETTVVRLSHAYGAQIGALHSMLDSLIDQDEDARLGQPSLIGLYPTPQAAAESMGDMAHDAMLAARSLPRGRHHAVLLAGMASLYLSDPQAREPRAAPVTAAVRAGIGGLATPAMVVFALWRLTGRPPTARTKATVRVHAAHVDPTDPERPAGACARVA